ncbi:MAG: hypothetical protein Q4C70_10845 [Planctomycetia bacterium]|nr:hypothetical protein [Planctomycetia bacterium]
MSESQINSADELQIVEDPNYNPPPEIEDVQIRDPYMDQPKNPEPVVTKKYVIPKHPPREKVNWPLSIGCLAFLLSPCVFMWFYANSVAGPWVATFATIALVILTPICLFLPRIIYEANMDFHSNIVKKGIQKAAREKRRNKRNRNR